ncbi:MAG: DUF4296 domain-containing protein [Bacteroidetes bacterium]|nr:DUF4296 domain-containing protein [Bacteroidota bacterium]
MKALKLVFIIIPLMFACKGNQVPEDVLGKQKMILIMADLHVIDGYMATVLYTDTIRKKSKNLYATIFKTHKVSSEQYERSLRYYSITPAVLDSMYNGVQAILDEKEHKLNRSDIKKSSRIRTQK